MHPVDYPDVNLTIPPDLHDNFLMEKPPGQSEKQHELRTFLLLTVVTAPLLSVLVVSGYGFLVWMYQAFIAGPPTGG